VLLRQDNYDGKAIMLAAHRSIDNFSIVHISKLYPTFFVVHYLQAYRPSDISHAHSTLVNTCRPLPMTSETSCPQSSKVILAHRLMNPCSRVSALTLHECRASSEACLQSSSARLT
jgi:hypothetical protein